MAAPSWIHCLNPACPLPQRQLCTCPAPTDCRQSCVYFVTLCILGMTFANTQPLKLCLDHQRTSVLSSTCSTGFYCTAKSTNNLLFCCWNNTPREKAHENRKQRSNQKQNYRSAQPWRSLFCRYSGLVFFIYLFILSREAKIKHAETAGVFAAVTVGLIHLHVKWDDGSKYCNWK